MPDQQQPIPWVQRYEYLERLGVLQEGPQGLWVSFEDYERVTSSKDKRIEQLTEQLEEIRNERDLLSVGIEAFGEEIKSVRALLPTCPHCGGDGEEPHADNDVSGNPRCSVCEGFSVVSAQPRIEELEGELGEARAENVKLRQQWGEDASPAMAVDEIEALTECAEAAEQRLEEARSELNATFNRWAAKKYADSVPLHGCEKAKVRTTAAAFRNAADYVLDYFDATLDSSQERAEGERVAVDDDAPILLQVRESVCELIEGYDLRGEDGDPLHADDGAVEKLAGEVSDAVKFCIESDPDYLLPEPTPGDKVGGDRG